MGTSPINWSRLLWLGRMHHALPFLYQAGKAAWAAAACPPAVFDQLAVAAEVNQLQSLARTRELCQLQDLFDQHGLTAIWLEPQVLGGILRSDLMEVGTRIPFWGPPTEVAEATKRLSEAGHPTTMDSQQLIKPGSRPVLPIRFERGLSLADKFSENQGRRTVGGRIFRQISPLQWLILRAPRVSTGAWVSLVRAYECVELCRELNADAWRELRARADDVAGLRHLITGLVASHHVLRVPVPEELLGAGGPVALADSPVLPPPVEDIDVAPFLPTVPRVMNQMLRLAATSASDVVYDLGCGDGRVLIAAAREFGASGVGVDYDPVRIKEATARATSQGVDDRVKFVCGDLFAQDLSQATVLCLYLLPGFYPRLHAKLRREARPGLRIVSHDYIFPDWEPEQTEIIRIGPRKISQIYLWRMGS